MHVYIPDVQRVSGTQSTFNSSATKTLDGRLPNSFTFNLSCTTVLFARVIEYSPNAEVTAMQCDSVILA